MKRALLFFAVVCAFISLACALFTPAPGTPATDEKSVQVPALAETTPPQAPADPEDPADQEDPAATEQEPAAQEEPAATEPADQEDPAATEPAATEPVDQEDLAETPTVEPTPTAEGPVEYVENFDRRNDYWSDPLVVTTQASGRDPYLKVTADNGIMRFAIQDKETYVYKFFLYTVDGNGAVKVEYTPKGVFNNGIAIVCRANEDLTSWYEVRLVSYNSEYNFYRYDKARKTEENKNPYVLLGQGRMAIKEYSPAKGNTFTLTCLEDTLILDVNDGKKIVEQPVDEVIEGNVVGVGAMSYDLVPVTMDLDTVTITAE